MNKFLLRIFVIFTVIFIQINFLDLIFLKNNLINLSILTLVSWIVISGFEKMWMWIFLLGFFNDVFFAERIGFNILFFIIFAYLISFASKSFIIERKLSGFLLVAVFILLGSFMGSFLNLLTGELNFSKEILIYGAKSYFISWENFIGANILAGVCFYGIYTFINKIEKHIARSDSKLNISF
ncbi:MAG: hypothetical protein ACD_7C00077G0010 [uncultured bacterium]|nr:MAG: hypothetical protein ACD_7C00077G0010 [uncultured bacterium]